jgi:hypothetical protein
VKIAVTLKGRLRVSAAEGVRAAVLANAGIAMASEWMFAPEIKDGTVKVVLQDWKLPRIDLWAVFPAGDFSPPSAEQRTCKRSGKTDATDPQRTSIFGWVNSSALGVGRIHLDFIEMAR